MQKTCCASESNTSIRVVFANRSGFDVPIGVVMAWEECGSRLNIFWTTNRGQILETFTNYEAKDLLRNGFDAPIGVVMAWEECGSRLKIFRTKICGRISETFTNFEAKDLLRKFWTINRGRISETFTSYEAKRLVAQERGSRFNIFCTENHGRNSESFMNYEILDDKSRSDLRNLHELRGKRLLAQESETRRFALYLRTGVDLMFRLDSL
ncbi:uncharacterized protein G2W53_041662 [Senna tora]|uniref:Uncharacterized protein n=1 Tax=Senna tora TaxID=362788 RepID=A0A834W1M7_9FABA|nr:uncharacterized protein G2W53_041662 [Senna tora]